MTPKGDSKWFPGKGEGKREAFPDGRGGDRPENFFPRERGTKHWRGKTKKIGKDYTGKIGGLEKFT